MTSTTIPFEKLSFSKLFIDYTRFSGEVRNFYQFHPTSDDALISRSKKVVHTLKPDFKKALLAYNDVTQMHPKAIDNLNALVSDPSTRTLVTGQQVTFAGGTLFTIYKILTAIVRAAHIEQKIGHKVVPIFWVADEDHDFDEISKIGFPQGNEWVDFSLEQPLINGQRAGQTPVQENIADLIQRIEETLPPTDHRNDIIGVLKKAYIPGSMHTDSFSRLITNLFSHFGLLIFGSAKNEARTLVVDRIKSLLLKSKEIHEELESTSLTLEKQYHRQAAVSDSNWFLVDGQGVRNKLSYDNGSWTTNNGHSFSMDELLKLVDSNPNAVSPNVFMRPLLQDSLLPNLALVGGPGEVAYYAQMKKVYEICEMEMPVIIPRFSATIFENSIRKYVDELSFSLSEYSQRIEDLEKKFIESTQEIDINEYFSEWSASLTELANNHTEVVERIDPTLVGTLKKVESDQINLLNQLKGKMFKALKNKQDIQLKRISRVQLALFPNRNLQERELAFIYILNKYGRSFIDDLAELMKEANLTEHHMIDL